MCQGLEAIRQNEIEYVRRWFPPGSRVLEIGGGSGYQASVLASWGCQVTSIDLPGRPAGSPYFPVQDYDGAHLPFPDGSFQIVFSSNVLEHVRDLETLLRETRRVLTADGVGLHLMPSVSWRFWTCVTHYVYIVRRLLGRGPARLDTMASLSVADKVQAQGVLTVLRKALFPTAHGEYGSAVAELYYFSRLRWRHVFTRAGFQVQSAEGHGLFYTGYGVWPGLTASGRRRIAPLLGSGCNVFVLRRVESDRC